MNTLNTKMIQKFALYLFFGLLCLLPNTEVVAQTNCITSIQCIGISASNASSTDGAINLTIDNGELPMSARIYKGNNLVGGLLIEGYGEYPVENLDVGNYAIYIRDNCNITESCQVQITEAIATLEVECSGNPTTNPGASDGSITLTVTGFTTQLIAIVDNGASVALINGNGDHILGNLSGGTYVVEITENGVVVATCEAVVEDGEVDACDNPMGLAGENQTICIGETATIGCEPIEGYCYYWSPTVGFSDPTQVMSSMIEVSPLETTTYTLMITDDDGNIVSPTTTDDDGNLVSLISVEVSLNGFTVEYSEVFEKCKEETITIQPTVSDGSGNFSYLWNTGETTSSIDVSPTESTLYSVEVQDVDSDLGCSFTVSLLVMVTADIDISIASSHSSICELAEPPALAGNLSESDNISTDCEDNNTITLTVESEANLNGYSFTWSHDENETGSSIDVFEAGVYTVTITNSDGVCSSSATFDLKSCFEVDITDDIVFDGSEPQIILDAGDGDSYLWSTGSTEQTIELADAEEYSVTVTKNGCVSVAEYSLTCEYSSELLKAFLCVNEGINNVVFFERYIKVCEELGSNSYSPFPGVVVPTGIVLNPYMDFIVDGSNYQVEIDTIKESGNINLTNYEIDFIVSDTEITFVLIFKDADIPNQACLRFETTNFGNIEALIKFLDCYQDFGITDFMDEINDELNGEDDCNKLDVILSGLPDDFIKTQITDNKKKEYVETLIACATCDSFFGGVDEKPIIVKLLRTFNDNQDLFNYLNNNPNNTTNIHKKLTCLGFLDASEHAKEFGSIVGALCSTYWPDIVDGTTEFVRRGKVGGDYPLFDPVAYTIGGNIDTDEGIYNIKQRVSGPIIPDFLQLYTIASNLHVGNSDFEIPPLHPVRLYDISRDESIYLPAVAIYNIALNDSYESIKSDVFNSLQLLGLGGSLRVLSLSNSSRLMNLVAAVEVVKVGALDQAFNSPPIINAIKALPGGTTFLDEVWPILSVSTDVITLVASSTTIFTSLDDTADGVIAILDDVPPNSISAQEAEDAAAALRAIRSAWDIFEALKKVYPVLRNIDNVDVLNSVGALSNAPKLLGNGVADAIKALDEVKQLALFDDFVGNSALIDKFATNPNLVNSWTVLFNNVALRTNDIHLETVNNFAQKYPNRVGEFQTALNDPTLISQEAFLESIKIFNEIPTINNSDDLINVLTHATSANRVSDLADKGIQRFFRGTTFDTNGVPNSGNPNSIANGTSTSTDPIVATIYGINSRTNNAGTTGRLIVAHPSNLGTTQLTSPNYAVATEREVIMKLTPHQFYANKTLELDIDEARNLISQVTGQNIDSVIPNNSLTQALYDMIPMTPSQIDEFYDLVINFLQP